MSKDGDMTMQTSHAYAWGVIVSWIQLLDSTKISTPRVSFTSKTLLITGHVLISKGVSAYAKLTELQGGP